MAYDIKRQEFSREHIYIVEIDRPRCTLTFATGTCVGGIWQTATTSSSGNWNVGDSISGGTSGATGEITNVSGSNPTVTLQYIVTNGIQFSAGETISNDTVAGSATQSGSITLQSTGDQKCYNTIGSCQSRANYTTEITTGATTLSVNASLQFSRASGSFITDGFAVNQVITTTGFANAGNNSQFRVTAVTATTISVKTNDGMVAETGSGDEEITAQNLLTYRFCENRSPQLFGLDAIPNLESVNIAPAQIDITGGLGVRASVSLSFKDHPHSDIGIDPYLSDRSYNAFETGTFWTKYRARNEDYQFDEIRVLSGYITDGTYNASNFETRYYLCDKVAVTRGGATITGKDTLSLAMKEKATAPVTSKGTLTSALTAGATTSFSVPSGTETEYPTGGGKVLIDKEIISYGSRSGTTFSTLTRGEDNTVAAAHSADATVQLVLEYSAQRLDDILIDLLTNYAEVSPSFIPNGAWASEFDTYMGNNLSAIIPKPTDVNKLLKELTEAIPHYLWWDEREQLIQMTALKAPPATANTISQDGQILKDSFTTTDHPEQRYSTVIVNYGQFDPTEKLDEVRNYQRALIRVDSNSLTKYKKNQIKTINTRWVVRTAAATATKIAQTIGRRFAEVPRTARFSLDAKDSSGDTGVWAGTSRYIEHSDMVDFNGNASGSIFQITSAKEGQDKFDFTAFEYRYGDLIAGENEELTDTVIYDSDIDNVNLLSDFTNEWGAPTGATDAVFIVKAGVTIGSTSTGTAGMDSGAFTTASSITIIIESGAKVIGKGGAGGSTGNGSAGGNAINIADGVTVTIKNSGIIGGGGGGGGGAYLVSNAAGGGGGAGFGVKGAISADTNWIVQSVSTDGTATAGGQGGWIQEKIGAEPDDLFGGEGGDLGEAGQAGTATGSGTEGTGGAAGKAVEDNATGSVTFNPQGDTRGAIT